MNKSSNLVDKYASFYTEGGWFASGKVVIDNDELYVIESEPENLCIVYKNKVCICKMLTKKQFEGQHIDDGGVTATRPKKTRPGVSMAELPDATGTSLYGSFIPADMLEEGETVDDDDFSVFFGKVSKSGSEE